MIYTGRTSLCFYDYTSPTMWDSVVRRAAHWIEVNAQVPNEYCLFVSKSVSNERYFKTDPKPHQFV